MKTPELIPWPVSHTPAAGSFLATPGLAIAADSAAVPAAIWLANRLRRATGWRVTIGADGPIRMRVVADVGVPSSYRLKVDTDGIEVAGADPAGLFHGCQTLWQLLPDACESAGAASVGFSVPCQEIADAPRFAWRGALLDSARGFHPVAEVLEFVDLLAAFKFNRFHWHLTDDQGWRLPIPGRPRLTEIGAWQILPDGSRRGGSYTAEEIRRVVAYAAERHIVVVPEIDMPGHTAAATASYPELSCRSAGQPLPLVAGNFPDVLCPGNEAVYGFIAEVLGEVARLFPGPLIHLGGDECVKDHWRDCPRCQAAIRERGLVDEKGLEHHFMSRAAGIVQKLGKRLMCWDETLETASAGVGHEVEVSYPAGPHEDPMPTDAVIQSWRDQAGVVAAARLGHEVIVSPYNRTYLNYSERDTPLETVYAFDPVPSALPAASAVRVVGLEACLWNVSTDRAQRWRSLLPRLCAAAEGAWTPSSAKDLDSFVRRLIPHRRRWQRLGWTPGRLPAVTVVHDQPRLAGDACVCRCTLRNRADEPAVARSSTGLVVALAPRQSVDVDVSVTPARPWDRGFPTPVEVVWSVRLAAAGATPLEEEHRLLIAPDAIIPVPSAPAGLPHAADPDGRTFFGLHHDATHLHIVVEARSSGLPCRPGVMPWQQDGIEIRVDGRTDVERFSSDGEREFRDLLLFAASPGVGADGCASLYRAPDLPAGTQVRCYQQPGGFRTEVAVPKDAFRRWRPEGLRRFRLNIAVNRADGDRVVQTSWRPAWRSSDSYPWSGTCELR